MRFLLRGMKDKNGWSQTQVGKLLDMGQQAAGTILNKNGGFSRPTALKLAELNGFDSPEALLAELRATERGPKPKEGIGWMNRDIAVRRARALEIDELAIERVVGRYTEERYMTRKAKWWVGLFIHEDRELEEERATKAAAPPSSSSLPVSQRTPQPKKKPKRRTA